MTAPEEAQEQAPDRVAPGPPEIVAGPQLITLDTEDAPVCENGVCL